MQQRRKSTQIPRGKPRTKLVDRYNAHYSLQHCPPTKETWLTYITTLRWRPHRPNIPLPSNIGHPGSITSSTQSRHGLQANPRSFLDYLSKNKWVPMLCTGFWYCWSQDHPSLLPSIGFVGKGTPLVWVVFWGTDYSWKSFRFFHWSPRQDIPSGRLSVGHCNWIRDMRNWGRSLNSFPERTWGVQSGLGLEPTPLGLYAKHPTIIVHKWLLVSQWTLCPGRYTKTGQPQTTKAPPLSTVSQLTA